MSNKQYELKIGAIDLIGKLIELPTGQPLQKDDINFDFIVDLKLSPEQKIAGVITDVTILRKPDNLRLAYFKLLTVFEFPKFEDIFTKVGDHAYDSPIEIEILLKSTGISTMRGIIYSELRGTHLNEATVMPLIDIASIIVENRKKKEVAQKTPKKIKSGNVKQGKASPSKNSY